MNWKLWQKSTPGLKNQKLPGPKEVPHPVGRVLVTQKNQDPDWVWSLKTVERPREGAEYCYDVRVFDANHAAKKGIPVRDYTSLDQSPEIILFEGWYSKKSNEAVLAESPHSSQAG
jgi:hypothetical protein